MVSCLFAMVMKFTCSNSYITLKIYFAVVDILSAQHKKKVASFLNVVLLI